ncbi:hypothetical protein [Carp edema virus]|nr:hypothetical protein [Carp edema virus]
MSTNRILRKRKHVRNDSSDECDDIEKSFQDFEVEEENTHIISLNKDDCEEDSDEDVFEEEPEEIIIDIDELFEYQDFKFSKIKNLKALLNKINSSNVTISVKNSSLINSKIKNEIESVSEILIDEPVPKKEDSLTIVFFKQNNFTPFFSHLASFFGLSHKIDSSTIDKIYYYFSFKKSIDNNDLITNNLETILETKIKYRPDVILTRQFIRFCIIIFYILKIHPDIDLEDALIILNLHLNPNILRQTYSELNILLVAKDKIEIDHGLRSNILTLILEFQQILTKTTMLKMDKAELISDFKKNQYYKEVQNGFLNESLNISMLTLFLSNPDKKSLRDIVKSLKKMISIVDSFSNDFNKVANNF